MIADYGHVGGDRTAIKRALLCHGPLHACGGGHCIVIVGWDDATNVWIIRNSWGAGWPSPEDHIPGSNGYGLVPYDYSWCGDAYYVAGVSGGFRLDFEENDGLAAGDVDGDGATEIVHGDRGDVVHILGQWGNLERSFGLDFEEYDGFAVGDVDGDGRAEIVQGDRSADRIRVFNMSGTEVLSFARDFEEGDGLAVGDVNGDGRAEFIHGDRSDDRIRVFDLRVFEIASFSREYEGWDGLAAGDVNGDGRAEIIHGDRDDRIYVLNMYGTVLASFPLDFEGRDGLTTGDINGDGRAEIIHGDRDNWIRALDMNGNKVWEFAADFEQGDGLAAGDVDGDGRAEIILGDRGDYIRIFHAAEGTGHSAAVSTRMDYPSVWLASLVKKVLRPNNDRASSSCPPQTSIGGARDAMVNPAAFYCAALGYSYTTVMTEEGERGLCQLPTGSVDEWAFLLGHEGAEYGYCNRQGYAQEVTTDPAMCSRFATDSCAVCVLDDGTRVEVTELMGLRFEDTVCGDGACRDPENAASCPADCPTGGLDGYCDGVPDGICDRDCGPGGDPDCTFLFLPTIMRDFLVLP